MFGLSRKFSPLSLSLPTLKRETTQILSENNIVVEDQEIFDALDILRVYSIFKKEKLTYSFEPKFFPTVIKESFDYDRLIKLEQRKFLESV